jgi:hypothetical protein
MILRSLATALASAIQGRADGIGSLSLSLGEGKKLEWQTRRKDQEMDQKMRKEELRGWKEVNFGLGPPSKTPSSQHFVVN